MPEIKTLLKVCLIITVSVTIHVGCVNADQSKQTITTPLHHAGKRFINPYLPPRKHGFLKYFKMRYFGGEEYADYSSNAHKVPSVEPDLERIKNPGEHLLVTWIGHATMLIQYRGVNILTDPVFSDRASPVSFAGPKRYHPPALQISDLPEVDYVVLSHSHYDHLDRSSVKKLGSGPIWLVPLRLKKWFLNAGIDESRILEFDWWDGKKFGPLTITATPVQHWSARTFWDRRKTLWASWMIDFGDQVVWYSGDTGYNRYQFKEIGEKFPDIDLALISIGAYEPRWFMKNMHINPEEAVKIHSDIRSKQSLGIQWGTFQLTAEPIDDPPIKLLEALKQNGVNPEQFPPMKIGETRVISNQVEK